MPKQAIQTVLPSRRARLRLRVFGFPRRDDMAIGQVQLFNASKGSSFIEPESGGKDLFIYISAVERGPEHAPGRSQGQLRGAGNGGKVSGENLRAS